MTRPGRFYVGSTSRRWRLRSSGNRTPRHGGSGGDTGRSRDGWSGPGLRSSGLAGDGRHWRRRPGLLTFARRLEFHTLITQGGDGLAGDLLRVGYLTECCIAQQGKA